MTQHQNKQNKTEVKIFQDTLKLWNDDPEDENATFQERADALIYFAEDVFKTPKERLKHAWPALFTIPIDENAKPSYEGWKDTFICAREDWDLKEDAELNQKIAHLLLDKFEGNLAEYASEADNSISALLPEEERGVIFETAVEKYVTRDIIANTSPYDLERNLSNIRERYVPKDRHVQAYKTLETKCFDVLNTPSEDNLLYDVTTVLIDFGSGLEWDSDETVHRITKLSTWITNPHTAFPQGNFSNEGQTPEIKRQQKNIIYRAKKELTPEALTEGDYNDQRAYIMDNSASIGPKAIALESAGEACPVDAEKVFSDVVSMAGEYVQGTNDVVKQVREVLDYALDLDRFPDITPDTKQKVFESFENMLIEAVAERRVNDEDLSKLLHDLADRFLTLDQRLKWLERLDWYVEDAENLSKPEASFLNFLSQEFKVVAEARNPNKRNGIIHGNNQKVAAEYIAGEFFLALSSQTVRNAHPLIYNTDKELLSHADTQTKIFDTLSTYPGVREGVGKQLTALVESVGQPACSHS